MSMLIGTYTGHMTFGEYMLSEGIAPTTTMYGDNPPYFDNKNITKLKDNLIGCFFIYDNLVYFVQQDINIREIGFAKITNIPNTYEELKGAVFDVKPMGTSDGLGVLNRAFYVFLEMLKISKVNKVFFSPASRELGRIYALLVKNRFFNNKLNEHGFSDLIFDNGVYATVRLIAS